MRSRLGAGIVGSGNIGTDLLVKIMRNELIEPTHMVGIDPDSAGLRRAADAGVAASHEGIEWLLNQRDLPDVVFDATSANAHLDHAKHYEEAGIQAIDLTPAAVGPFVVPVINMEEHLHKININMVSCGAQATLPVIAAVKRVVAVDYAEIVASIASRSAGPGTRANIDEFTRTTANAIEEVAGATSGKAIIVLNPAEPPIIMRDTVFCMVPSDADQSTIKASVDSMVNQVAEYVPGYRLRTGLQFDGPRHEWQDHGRVTAFLEVEGNGDYLPPYAGNLDIMTAAALRVGESIAKARVGAR